MQFHRIREKAPAGRERAEDTVQASFDFGAERMENGKGGIWDLGPPRAVAYNAGWWVELFNLQVVKKLSKLKKY